jgi:hypothetical protein
VTNEKESKQMTGKIKESLWRLAPAAAAIAVAGCSAMPSFGRSAPTHIASSAAPNPPPRVQNCGIVSIGSPTKYVCNDKVYTSFELVDLQQDWDKDHGVER